MAVLAPAGPSRIDRSVPTFARDGGAVAGVMLAYFVLRGAVPGRIDDAVGLSLKLIRIEKAVGLFREQQLQELTLRSDLLRSVANFLYAFLHFPALICAGLWAWWRDRPRFRQVRNTLYVSMVIGLVMYYVLPAAPPRLMALHGHDFGFVDTVFSGNGVQTYPQWSPFRNEYAAIPSFHFGWMALASAAFWTTSRSPWIRSGAIALTVVMTWASAATANHFFIDMALGGLVVWLSWLIAARITPRAPAAAANRVL